MRRTEGLSPRRMLLGALLGATLLGAGLAGSLSARADAPSAASGGIVTHPGPDVTYHTAFRAVERGDGRVTGEFELLSQYPLFTGGQARMRIHAQLDCMVVNGNVVSMSGVVTQWSSNDPTATDFTGYTLIFSAQDNGEGPNSPPDRISYFDLLPPGSGEDCHTFQPYPYARVAAGDVQVRP